MGAYQNDETDNINIGGTGKRISYQFTGTGYCYKWKIHHSVLTLFLYWYRLLVQMEDRTILSYFFTLFLFLFPFLPFFI